MIVKRRAQLNRAFLFKRAGAGFSSMVMRWMAPVGHTWPQSVQFTSQKPSFMFRIGVHTPSSPDSSTRRLQHVGGAGADALVALDAAVQKILFLHRAWRADDFLVVVAVGGARGAAKREKAQARASVPRNARRPGTAGAVTSRCIGGMNLNESASSGQSSMQLKHTKHSLLRNCVCGSDAPSQFFRHRSQSTHLAVSRSMRQRDTVDSVPRNAPSGQSTRQKKRGMTTFMPTRNSSMNPMAHAPT